jgi:hypothetical protein
MGDYDSARLAAKVIDAMDKVLFDNELAFKEDASVETFHEEFIDIIHRYYDDLTGGDPDWVPGESQEDGDMSVSLESECEEGSEVECESCECCSEE